MKLFRCVAGLALGLLLSSCDTFQRDKTKAEPPVEIIIRSTDILEMQRILTASFAQQGWVVVNQTTRALSLSQPMTPDDAARYYGRFQMGSPDADIHYFFSFEPRKQERTFVTGRVLGVSPAAYGRVVTAELTDPKARRQIETVLRALKKEMEKGRPE
jgi:hypothetical protein